MKQASKNTLLVVAIVAGLFSIPMTWMKLYNAQIQGGFGGGSFNDLFAGMSINVTGLNGHVTALVETPIWFIVMVAIGASVLQLMSQSKNFAIPPTVEWGTAILAVIWVGIAIVSAIFSNEASLGIGALLGLACAATPLAMLMCPTEQSNLPPSLSE